MSFLYALFSVIRGVKHIKTKESYLVLDLIAIIGGSLILIVCLFVEVLILVESLGGFPNQD